MKLYEQIKPLVHVIQQLLIILKLYLIAVLLGR